MRTLAFRHHLLLVLIFTLAAPQFAAAQDEKENPLIATVDDLLNSLTRAKIKFEHKPESNMVLFEAARGTFEGVTVVIWDRPNAIAHFMQVFPLVVPAENMSNVESAFTRLNHSIAMPGLGINHSNNRIYFRTSVPLTPRGGIPEDEVYNYFHKTLFETAAVYPTVQALVIGKLAPEKALAFYTESNKPKSVPKGEYTRTIADTTWKLIFGDNGAMQVVRDGEVAVKSVVTAPENGVIVIQDKEGKMAEEAPGKYGWGMKAGVLMFETVDDKSVGRSNVLTSGKWKLVE